MTRNLLLGILVLALTACQTASPRQTLSQGSTVNPVTSCEAEIYRSENQQTLDCARLLDIWN